MLVPCLRTANPASASEPRTSIARLLQFLATEIETTLALARLAETEVGLGDREAAAAAMAKAKQGHDETLRWMAHLEELVEALQSLRTRVDLDEG